ncbi:hypothetical protein GW17_00060782, partial [Ensete ventricosum]
IKDLIRQGHFCRYVRDQRTHLMKAAAEKGDLRADRKDQLKSKLTSSTTALLREAIVS